MYQDIEYNGVRSSAMKIYARERPSIPAAQQRTEEITILGRDGSLFTSDGAFEPTEIPVLFNYIGKETQWADRWRKAQEWLSARNSILRFADDSGFFFRISHVTIDSVERTTARIGNFTATFHTRDGLYYLDTGLRECDPEEIGYNPYETAHPIYKITGEGTCTIIVNGNQIRANVGQNLTIDTERMIAYRQDGTLQNTKISGDYENMYLTKGMNRVRATDGFDVKIIPNWRCR